MGSSEDQHWQDVYDRAALHAETATVCAIGYGLDSGFFDAVTDADSCDEWEILEWFWDMLERAAKESKILVGFNINRFDIPFLIRRSWYLSVIVPPMQMIKDHTIDLMERWQCGDQTRFVKLDTVCKACGIVGKPSDCTGKNFHKLLDDPETRAKALRYLENDIDMTRHLARRMQIDRA